MVPTERSEFRRLRQLPHELPSVGRELNLPGLLVVAVVYGGLKLLGVSSRPTVSTAGVVLSFRGGELMINGVPASSSKT